MFLLTTYLVIALHKMWGKSTRFLCKNISSQIKKYLDSNQLKMKCSAQQMASINSNRRLINSEMGQDNIFKFQDWINWKISTNPWPVQQFEKNFQIHLDYSCLSTTTTRKNYANCCWLWRRECWFLSVVFFFQKNFKPTYYFFQRNPIKLKANIFINIRF